MSTTKYEVVRREIKAKGGRVLEAGDVFTWEDLGDDELRAKRQIKVFIEHGLVAEVVGQTLSESGSGATKRPNSEAQHAEFPRHVGGPWYETPSGDRFKGKKAALAAMQE